MKRIVSSVCAVCILVSTWGQTPLCIATDTTTCLIFPNIIKHVDRGTKDILVQPVKEAGNILLVKASQKDFAETNLSIITDDGSVYSIPVRYGQPAVWVYHFPVQNRTSIQTYCNSIIDNPRIIRGVKDACWNMIATISGIYIRDDVMYCHIDVRNESSIDYDVSFLRFYIRDKKKSRRTALQENELRPLYVAGNTSVVKANTHSSIVVALDKFTIPGAKYLAVEMGEQNGGRELVMKMGNRKIIKAVLLPDIR